MRHVEHSQACVQMDWNVKDIALYNMVLKAYKSMS